MRISSIVRRAVQVNKNGLASNFQDRSHDWTQFAARVSRLAAGLRNLGVNKGDRVAMLGLNSDRYLEYFFAVPWAGGVFVPINTRLAPPEVVHWMNDSGAKVLLIDDNFTAMLPKIQGQLESLKTVVHVGDGARPEGMLSFEGLIDGAGEMEPLDKGGDELAGLFYTGGTTGRSKGVMLSHRNLVSNSYHIIPSMFYRPGMCYLHAPPMFHIADGLAVFGVTMIGGSHTFIPGFAPDACLDAIQKHQITDTLLVPTMMNMLVNHPDVGKHDLSSLESVVYGASPMPEAVISRALEVIPGVKFTHAYGQTECAPLSTCNGPESHVLEGPNAGLFKSA